MKRLAIWGVFVASMLGLLFGCHKDTELTHREPDFSAPEVVVGSKSATLSFTVDYEGEYQTLVLYSTRQNLSDSVEVATQREGQDLRAHLDGLTPNTKYYYQCVVRNAVSSFCSETRDFKTNQLAFPEVTTNSVTDITIHSAKSGGDVTSDGGGTITERGICWGLELNPTMEGLHVAAASAGTGSFQCEMTELIDGTTYHVRAYAVNEAGVAYGADRSFETPLVLLPPSVALVEVKDVTASGATCLGNVTSDGGTTVTDRGVCWSTQGTPTLNGNHLSCGSGTGQFTATLSGLNSSTQYQVCCYAVNSEGIAYSEVMTFTTTDGHAIVLTVHVDQITATSAVGHGEVRDEGASVVTERGICWSTSHNPTIAGSHVACGSGMGSFNGSMTGLTANGTYYVRAYATNQQGTSYGAEISFTALEGLPVVTTMEVTDVTANSAIGHGNVTDQGASAVTERGICWSTSHNPTIGGSHQAANNGGTGNFNVTMGNLTPGTKYYVKAYAKNNQGCSYGSEVEFVTQANKPTVTSVEVVEITQTTAVGKGEVTDDGGATVTERGVCWSTNINPTYIGNHQAASTTGTGAFSVQMSGLTPQTRYYLKAYAINSEGVSYGDIIIFTTEAVVSDPVAPTVNTYNVTNITQTSAQGGGYVVSDGGSPVTERGVCWGTNSTPTINGSHQQASTAGTGSFTVTMNGLSPSTAYYVRAYARNSIGVSYGDAIPFNTSESDSAPTVVTLNPTNVTSNSAMGAGNVTADNGAAVTERGMCWGTGENPTVSGTHQAATTTGVGAYTVSMTELNPGTTYHVRAYAINSVGLSYGNDVTFTTQAVAPTVNTSAVTSITQTTAEGGGEVTSDGGASVTERGICWSTSHNPTTSGTHLTVSTGGTGAFSLTMTELSPGTTYYVRAYAKNSVSTSYGSEVQFTTLDVDPVSPSVHTSAVTNITQTTATGGGSVTSDGGASVTERGICWSTSPNPTTSGTYQTATSAGVGDFTVAMTGLSQGTTYYVRAYAVNSVGTSYGNQEEFTTLASLPTVETSVVTGITQTSAMGGGNVTSDGGAEVTERGLCWGTNNTPTTSGNHQAASSVGMGSFTVQMTGLAPGTSYYVRAYAINSQGTSYGTAVQFTTSNSVSLPTVSTNAITNVSQYGATGGGNVTSDGGASVTERGVCWSTNHNPTTSSSHQAASSAGTGTFSVYLENLTASTTYYVRAYATNSVGTNYGEEVSFSTNGKPTVTTTSVTALSATTAVMAGEVTSNGGYTLNNRGVCWSATHSSPDVNDFHAEANPATLGTYTVNMTGLTPNTTYYVRAYAQNSFGYGYGAVLTVTTPQLTAPQGAIDGLFTVNAGGEMVWFSQGNLKYNAAANQWAFADHQYDYVGTNNENMSSTYNGWIDLYGWATSGWNSGVPCYQPWSHGQPGEYFAGGNLTNSYANADWGVYNGITNGGAMPGMWRTLTRAEWKCVFNTRATDSGHRYAKAVVNGVKGVILLPDHWQVSYYSSLSSYDSPSVDYGVNNISSGQWPTLESHGAVFLPAAGQRNSNSTNISQYNDSGHYWSSTISNGTVSYSLSFSGATVNPENSGSQRSMGFSVRLVKTVSK